MWTELPDFCKKWQDIQRSKRLEKPTKECFKNGSGVYMNRARLNRTLAFKTMQQVTGKRENWYYHTIKYMMNNVFSRKWIVETGKKQKRNIRMLGIDIENEYCPLCKLYDNEKQQTKEHIWSGECIGTKDIVENWKLNVSNKCETYKIGRETIEDIIEVIKEERDSVQTQVYTLNNHGKSAALMGMWSNDTIVKVKNILVNQEWEPSRAMKMTLSLMQVMQVIGEDIAKRFQYNMEVFIDNLKIEEVEEFQKKIDIREIKSQRIQIVKSNTG